MELDVSKALLTPGTEFPFMAEVTVPPQDVVGETVAFDTVKLQGTYSALDGIVRLAGWLTTTAHAACALCLNAVDAPLRIAFDERYRKDANEIEDEVFRYEGSKAPLDQLALTLLMLNLPMRFLCEGGCGNGAEHPAGVQTIFKSSCEEESPTQRPFEALQRLLTKDEEV